MIPEFKFGTYRISIVQRKLFYIPEEKGYIEEDYSDHIKYFEAFRRILGIDEFDDTIELVDDSTGPIFIKAGGIFNPCFFIKLSDVIGKDEESKSNRKKYKKESDQSLYDKYKKIGDEIHIMIDAFMDSGLSREDALQIICVNWYSQISVPELKR